MLNISTFTFGRTFPLRSDVISNFAHSAFIVPGKLKAVLDSIHTLVIVWYLTKSAHGALVSDVVHEAKRILFDSCGEEN